MNRSMLSFATKFLLVVLSLPTLGVTLQNTHKLLAKEPWQLAQETEVWSPVPPIVNTSETTPPADAIMLFNGSDLSQWQHVDGGDAKWQIQNGAMTIGTNAGSIKTKEHFCDVQLHIEWMTPTTITDNDGKSLEGQGRSNSGVFFQEKYEVQILDSFNNKTYSNGQAGAIYKQKIPLVNASRAPGVWQSYDIIFNAPTFNQHQKLIKPAFITVLHNGVLIQNHTEIKGATEWIGKPSYKAHGCASIMLQDHGSPVSFRNIWVRRI